MTIHFRTDSTGKVSQQGASDLRDVFSKFKPSSQYQVTIQPTKSVWKGRYRFYFGQLLLSVLNFLKFQKRADETVTVEDLHEYCKELFRGLCTQHLPEIKGLGSGTATIRLTTKHLSNAEFFIFEDAVTAYFQTLLNETSDGEELPIRNS